METIKNVCVIPKNFTGIAEWSWTNKDPWIKHWYVRGKLHRTDGPAIEYANGTKSYYINDKYISKEAHELLCNLMKLKEMLLKQ